MRSLDPRKVHTSSTTPYFSPDFTTAQGRFRAAVAVRKGRLDVLKLAARGPRGEELTIDIGMVWRTYENLVRRLTAFVVLEISEATQINIQ